MDMKAGMLEPRNMYKNYTMGLYLAISPKRLNIEGFQCIDTLTGLVDKEGFSQLTSTLIQLYSQPVSQKIKSIYGVGHYKTYFDLYDFAIKSHKDIHLNLIEFLKEEGKREFYYALKNINEAMQYKEGLLFSQLSLIHKNKLTMDELLTWTQDVIEQEAKNRLQKDLITRKLVHAEPDNTQVVKSTAVSVVIQVPSFDPKRSTFNDGSVDANILKERTEARIKFTKMFAPYKGGIDLVLGYQDKGLFQKKHNCLNLNIHNSQEGIIIAGEEAGPKELLRSYIYQSISNSSGLLLFSALSDKSTLSYVFQVAKHFDITDDVHVFYYGSDELAALDMNDYIKSNKVVLILYPEFSGTVSNEIQLMSSYDSINKVISNITVSNLGKGATKFPFNIYLNELSFTNPVEQHMKTMIDTLSSLYVHNVNFYIVNESLTILYSDYRSVIFDKIKNFIVLFNESGQEVCQNFATQKLKPVDFSKLEPLEFYYFSDNVLVNSRKFNGIYMPIDIDVNLEEHLN